MTAFENLMAFWLAVIAHLQLAIFIGHVSG
jgi:hypothetical protein